MLSPSDYLNQFNFNGQFSLPVFTPYSLLTLNNLPNSYGVNGINPPLDDPSAHNIGDHTLPQGSLEPNKIDPNPLNLGLQDTITGWLSTYFKDMALLSLALLLLGLGLYMLVASTNTGKAAIGAATKAAMA